MVGCPNPDTVHEEVPGGGNLVNLTLLYEYLSITVGSLPFTSFGGNQFIVILSPLLSVERILTFAGNAVRKHKIGKIIRE